MMDIKYSARNLEECLQKAESDLFTARENFSYKILSEEKGIFKKKCIIEVFIDKETENSIDTQDESGDVIIDGDRIIIDFNGDSEIEIHRDEGIDIFVNDEKVENLIVVKPNDQIRFVGDKINAIRKLNISVDDDNMQARLDIDYIPEKNITIQCDKVGNVVEIHKRVIDGELPPLYTEEEIRKSLNDKGIIFGIIDENVKKVSESEKVVGELVAKGIESIDDEEDKLQIYFESGMRNIVAESDEKIDYRKLYTLAYVKDGETIAEIIEGKEGVNGKDIYGNESKKKDKNKIDVKVREGCKLEENKIIATVEGRPNIKAGAFYVNKVLEVMTDVNMQSGDVDFEGDVSIKGSIKDGMTVKSGNRVEIKGNVETATVISQGETIIKGSVLNSKIVAGSIDLSIENHVNCLNDIKKDLSTLVAAITEIRKKQIVSDKEPDGQLVKLLIETKFKKVPLESSKIIKNQEFNGEYIDEIRKKLREKIIGSGPLGIKYLNEVTDLIKCIDKEIEIENEKINQPVDIYINYCQDANLKSTGNIYLTGKGEYISNLSAQGDIEFINDSAVARGGTLESGGNIKAKTIGSIAGVTTILKVPKVGIITADVAYQNSEFIFGERRYVLDNASKNVKAFLNKQGDIEVEKFIL